MTRSLNARQSLQRVTPVVTSFNMTSLPTQNQAQITTAGVGVKNDALVDAQLDLECGDTFSTEKVHAI